MANVRFVNADPNIGKDLPDTQICPKGHPWGHSPDCPWLTIQFSVDQLARIGGGILNVATHQYTENVIMSGKAYSHISIVGDPNGPPSTSPYDAVFCEVLPLLVAKDPNKPTILIERADDTRLQDLCITKGNHGVHADDVKTLKVITCCIYDNTAIKEAGGGFLFEQCSEVLVKGCRIFSNDTQDPIAGMGGGGAMNKCEDITVEGCYFHSNTAGLTGGGLRVDHCPKKSRVTIEDNIFGDKDARKLPPGAVSKLGNKANSGGSISVDFCKDVDVRMGFARANFHYMNEAKISGGAIAIEISTCRIGQDQFFRNKAEQDGGALMVHNNFAVKVLGSNFEKNEAVGGDGGALWTGAELAPGKLILSSVKLETNKATTGKGGGIFAASDVELSIASGNFTDNTAGDEGGGLHYTGDTNVRRLDITGTLFNHNTSAAAGGGCFISEADAVIGDSRFNNNVAAGNGGGLIFKGSGAIMSSLKLDDNRFQNNQAAAGGGAFIEETLKGSIQTNYVVTNQGGLYFLKDKMLALGIKTNTFKGNTTKAGVLEDIVSEKDVSKPPLTQAQLANANIVKINGVIVK